MVVRLRVPPGGSPDLARAVADGTLDLALLLLPADPPTGVALRRLAREPLVLICAPGHPLAGAGETPLDALGGETFIDFPAGWGTRTVIDRAFAAAGIDRQVAFEVPFYDVAVGLAGNGLGVAFLPAFVAADTEGVARVTVTGLFWQIQVATTASRRPSAAARAFLGDLPAEGLGAAAAVNRSWERGPPTG